ncbi:thioesterase family protein [[Mycobacterium] wendilense]|uniref:Thioesterase family protein n=2 Tax=[Mycobacterium] wendilense TaxID=3064284 RepID=A0ABM9M7Y8_9MYCO|nr:thioesterase family protein [Mycolicibacterium sp. MU0050]CAJ1578424.1 thioesterase family protein [Mycolicibacterium sp. MU0050]
MSADIDAVDAVFTRDGDSYLPSDMARGPWGETMAGQIVGGLLGFALDTHGDPQLQPARFTVDLMRPVFLKPVQIQTTVQREGRRLKLVDATLLQDGEVVARASALYLRRGDHPEGQVWTSPVSMPAPPQNLDGMPDGMPFHLWSYNTRTDVGSPGLVPDLWQTDTQKFAWVRLARPIVAGHPVTPFSRAAFVGDVTSSLTHWSTGGLRYINADYTVTLSRMPVGDLIGLAAQSHYGADGVATGSATLFDTEGPIGTSVAVALAQPADAFRPSRRFNPQG